MFLVWTIIYFISILHMLIEGVGVGEAVFALSLFVPLGEANVV